MFALDSKYDIVGFYKTLMNDEGFYIAEYFCKQDMTILIKNAKRVCEIKGEISLDSILNKVKMIEVFS